VLDRLRRGKHLLRDEKLARLSPQEERILGLVAAGRTNRQVGEELGLAEKTVKNYVSSILMTGWPTVVSPETDVREAVAAMLEVECRHLPVVEDDQVVGMVSIRDLLGTAIRVA
jgi:DNA-binding CsgD family transcriptional regulator